MRRIPDQYQPIVQQAFLNWAEAWKAGRMDEADLQLVLDNRRKIETEFEEYLATGGRSD